MNDLNNMTSDELNRALEQVLQNTDRETKIKVIRALMKYRNIDGLDLEKILEKELDL